MRYRRILNAQVLNGANVEYFMQVSEDKDYFI